MKGPLGKIENQTKVKILVVEDEALLAQDIALRLEGFGYEVVGTAQSADEALQILTDDPLVDIALLDIIIQGEQDGIALAQQIKAQYQIPFIFLSSHADAALVERAKQVQPYAYILKPFNDQQICIAIELALTNFSKSTPERNLLDKARFAQEENQVLQIKDSLFLKKDHHFQRVPLQEIEFLEADNNYTTVYTKGERFIYSTVLKKIEAQLPSRQFLRIHRSYVVNIQSVQGFEGNMLFIGEQKIPVSKSYREEVFKLFKTI